MRSHTVLIAFLLFLVLPGIAASDDHYLSREILNVPTTGATRLTSAPLEPYVVYSVRVSSPLDLADIVNRRIDILLSGSRLVILDFDTGLFDVVNHIYSLHQGTGHPLAIELRATSVYDSSRLQEFRQRIPTIEVAIARHHWWQSRHGHWPHPLVFRVAVLAIGIAVLVVYFTYLAPGSLGRLAQFFQTHREEVLRHVRPAEPFVRVLRRPPDRRPQTPNPTRITHQGENHENDRD